LPEEVEREGFVLALGATDSAARELSDSLRARGFSLLGEDDRQADLVLVSQDLLWKSWGVRPEAKAEDAPAAARRRYEVLRAQGLDLPTTWSAGQSDGLDAAAAAFAAYLWATGQAGSEGSRILTAGSSASPRKTRGGSPA
jgi:hypothetical protein